jgi:hypothetical protein
MTMSGICPSCGALRQLTEDGRLVVHHYVIRVSKRAIPAAGGQARARRRCPGSGKGVEKDTDMGTLHTLSAKDGGEQ